MVGHSVATLRAHFPGPPAREANVMPLHSVFARARRSESELANTLAIRDGTIHRIGNWCPDFGGKAAVTFHSINRNSTMRLLPDGLRHCW